MLGMRNAPVIKVLKAENYFPQRYNMACSNLLTNLCAGYVNIQRETLLLSLMSEGLSLKVERF